MIRFLVLMLYLVLFVLMWLFLFEVVTISSLTQLGWLVCLVGVCLAGIIVGVSMEGK